jgi:hypothetical protein
MRDWRWNLGWAFVDLGVVLTATALNFPEHALLLSIAVELCFLAAVTLIAAHYVREANRGKEAAELFYGATRRARRLLIQIAIAALVVLILRPTIRRWTGYGRSRRKGA